MNWIRPATSVAIYMRDGLACSWCGTTIEDGARLTLDHCKPRSKGGSNDPTNLVTSCLRCNTSRGTRTLTAFAKAVAEYVNHDVTAKSILAHIKTTRRRLLDKNAARAIIKNRNQELQTLLSNA
jgi:hypothetical protein